MNITGLQNAETFSDLIIYNNEITSGLLTGSFLIFFFIVFLMLFRRQGLDTAMATAGLICFVISIFLKAANIVAFPVVVVFFLITAFSIFYRTTIGKSR